MEKFEKEKRLLEAIEMLSYAAEEYRSALASMFIDQAEKTDEHMIGLHVDLDGKFAAHIDERRVILRPLDQTHKAHYEIESVVIESCPMQSGTTH